MDVLVQLRDCGSHSLGASEVRHGAGPSSTTDAGSSSNSSKTADRKRLRSESLFDSGPGAEAVPSCVPGEGGSEKDSEGGGDLDVGGENAAKGIDDSPAEGSPSEEVGVAQSNQGSVQGQACSREKKMAGLRAPK